MTANDAEAAGTRVPPPASTWLLWGLVLEGLVLVASAPGIVGLLLLDRSPGAVPLAALCLLPAGPALSAAVFAWNRLRTGDPADPDLRPARAFARGYRLNWADVLRWWVPTLVLLALLGVNPAHAGLLGPAFGPGGGGNAALAVVSLVLAAALLCWAATALLLTSVFAFRTRDIARLAVYYLLNKPLVGLRVAALVLVLGALVVVTGDVWVWALASLVALGLVLAGRAVVADATEQFVGRPARDDEGYDDEDFDDEPDDEDFDDEPDDEDFDDEPDDEDDPAR